MGASLSPAGLARKNSWSFLPHSPPPLVFCHLAKKMDLGEIHLAPLGHPTNESLMINSDCQAHSNTINALGKKGAQILHIRGGYGGAKEGAPVFVRVTDRANGSG
jgi:hypothetical protein